MIGLLEELLDFWIVEVGHGQALYSLRSQQTSALLPSIAMTTAPSEPLSQRLAAIRDQLTLLADYL